jgi:hypothetical protein
VTRATTAIGFALAVAAGSCGSDTIDADEVEAGIEQSLSGATAAVSSGSCPNDVEKEEGATSRATPSSTGAAPRR